MNYKPFDNDLCKENDQKGKQVVIDFFDQLYGAKCIYENNESKSFKTKWEKWDLKFKLTDGTEFKVETEVKSNPSWWGKFEGKQYPFKYDTVNIPHRKHNNDAKVFFVVSGCGKFIFTVSKNKLEKSQVIKKDNKYMKNEPFFNINVDDGFFFEKINGTWKKIN